MTTTTLARPVPTGKTDRGIATYACREVAAYRAARGVTQIAVAARMRVAQSYIARLESGKDGAIHKKWAELMLDATDAISATQDKLIARGIEELEAIRTARNGNVR